VVSIILDCAIESGFFSGGFLVAPVALTFRNDLLGLAAPVRRERLPDIHLVLGELSLLVTAGRSVYRPDAVE
jgi:hypothetical protein